MNTHAAITFDNRATLTFDLLSSVSMHAEILQWSTCPPHLVLIAQAVFISEHRYTWRKWQEPLLTLSSLLWCAVDGQCQARWCWPARTGDHCDCNVSLNILTRTFVWSQLSILRLSVNSTL